MLLLDLRSPVLLLDLRSRRGFTAVELMVAITASMVVCAAAYTLAKSSVDLFQQEARMNAAQFSNLVGMNRLLTDIKRAGFMASPDASIFPGGDPELCAAPTAEIAELMVAINVTEGDEGTWGAAPGSAGIAYPAQPGDVMQPSNARRPDRIRLAGNYATSERFKLGNVDTMAALPLASLDIDQLSVQRIFRDNLRGGPDICDFFPPTGIARVVDVSGKYRFVGISACVPTINVANTNYAKVLLTLESMPFAPGCGEATGGYINPVNIIDYAPIHMSAAADTAASQGFNPAMEAITDEDITNNTAGITGNRSRLFLVRRQLSNTGAVLVSPLGVAQNEVVADYVVDLNFQARLEGGLVSPAVTTSPGELTPAPFGTVGPLPANRIRSLGVRFSTRARNPDRENSGVTTAANEDQPLQRFEVITTGGTQRLRFARVRTLFTEVSIPNLQGKTPW